MKKQIFNAALLLAVCAGSVAQAQQKYIIKGRLTGLTEQKKIMLSYWTSKTDNVKDSAIVNNGEFTLTGTISRPYKVSVYLTSVIPQPQRQYKIGDIVPAQDGQSFYLTGGETVINGVSLNKAIIHNAVQDEYLEQQAALQPLARPMGALNLKIYNNKNKDSVEIYKAQRNELSKQFAQTDVKFVKSHPNSYVSFDLVKNYGIVISDPDSFGAMLNALGPKFKNTPEVKHMQEDLAALKQLGIGQKAFEFSQPDVNGKPVSLSSLKGKYVLVDFWASWCGPCRMEYPFLHKAYNQFKDKNFEIIGVSIDDKKDLWVNSIAENKFPWIEVSDLKGRQNEVARLYGVSAIPQSFLLDPKGVIIAKNLRGEDLIDKLKEVLK